MPFLIFEVSVKICFFKVTITDEDLNSALQKDTMSHTRVKGVRGIKLMPDAGSCGLHWDLCPNMCNLNETLENYFQEIVGNKMTKVFNGKYN